MAPDEATTKRERREAARAARQQREAEAAAAETRRRRLLQLGGLLAVAAVVVIVAIVASSGGGGSSTSSSGGVNGVAQTRQLLGGIPQKGITLGNPKAPVTVVEFADPQCPFCKQYTLNEMPKVVQDYVRTGKAKMDLRLLTFIGPDSVKAGEALEAAGLQNKLWSATDLMYHNQGEENTGYVTNAFLRNILGAVPGLDVNQAMKASTSDLVSQQLGASRTLASQYGVNSTPTILVGPTGGTLKDVGGQGPTAASVGAAIKAAMAKGQSGT